MGGLHDSEKSHRARHRRCRNGRGKYGTMWLQVRNSMQTMDFQGMYLLYCCRKNLFAVLNQHIWSRCGNIRHVQLSWLRGHPSPFFADRKTIRGHWLLERCMTRKRRRVVAREVTNLSTFITRNGKRSNRRAKRRRASISKAWYKKEGTGCSMFQTTQTYTSLPLKRKDCLGV